MEGWLKYHFNGNFVISFVICITLRTSCALERQNDVKHTGTGLGWVQVNHSRKALYKVRNTHCIQLYTMLIGIQASFMYSIQSFMVGLIAIRFKQRRKVSGGGHFTGLRAGRLRTLILDVFHHGDGPDT